MTLPRPPKADVKALYRWGTQLVQALEAGSRLPSDPWHFVGGENSMGVTFQNGWVNYDADASRPARFRKDNEGKVEVAGVIKNGTVGVAAFTLPPGYRPKSYGADINPYEFTVDSNGVLGFVLARPDGSIVPSGSNVYSYLSGINFYADGTKMALAPGTGGGGTSAAKKKPKKGGLADIMRGAAGAGAGEGALGALSGLSEAIGGGGGGQPPPDPFDFSADPILNQAKAFNVRGRADAEADWQRFRTQLAIEYGDPTLGGEAAAANPFSFLAKMSKAKVEEPKKLDEQLNPANLFYSSTADKSRTDLAGNLLERETKGASAFRGGLEGLDRNLRDALLGFDKADADAAAAAADRRKDLLGDTPQATGGGAGGAHGAIAQALKGVYKPPKKPGKRPTGLQE